MMRRLLGLATLALLLFNTGWVNSLSHLERVRVRGHGDDPPLALLMRRMMADAEAAKAKVAAGKAPGRLPKQYHNLPKLESSQEDAKGPVFESMAASYLAQAQKLYAAADAADRPKQWNLMVAQCLHCHQAYCPGPLKRIERLRLPEPITP